ncbi:ABC transporter substrate-binding protein [Salipiger mangrovisoli]|uniref:Thiamine pyrimidine synthase n=1 Tax=Salipiger mangrovisoli TaxID=2865933 RepID=A0ABR9X843_9RHOB|nr:ABC transporter substrate-binding protein [Salipiger mangrovisoli]MBE9639596.1 ABC transporter substrate-binding protein [Salipiger mangrovisoli]
MKRRSFLSTLGLAASTAMLAAPAVQAADLESVSLRLKWLPQAQFVGFYMAKAKGYYEDEGLDLAINPGGPNLLTENLVATGADTFGLSGGTDSVFAAIEKGLPITCIGISHQETPFVFVSKADGPVQEIADFKDASITTWFTGANYVLFGMLAANDIDRTDMNIQPQQVSVTPFVDGQVDVVTATRYNEYYTLMQRVGEENLKRFVPEDFGVSFPRDTLIVGNDFAAEHPELVQGFMRASVKGWLDAFADKEAAIDLIMKEAPTLERPHQEFMLDEVEKIMLAGAAAEQGLFTIDMDAVSSAHQILVDYDVLGGPIDLEAAFDSQFIDAIPSAERLPE